MGASIARVAGLARAFYMRGSMSEPDADIRLKKLRFRAWHRGFREADLILGPFADQHLAGMNAVELDAFEALIDQPDHDLYDWIVGRAEAPAAVQGSVLERIRAFRFSLPIARGEAGGV
jgi:antitoxin CptB